MRILFAQNHPRDPRLGSPKSVLRLGAELERLGHTVDYLFAPEAHLLHHSEKLRFVTFPLALAQHLRQAERCRGYDVVDIASGDGWLYGRTRGASGPVLVSRVLGLEHLYWQETLKQVRLGEVRLTFQHRLWFGRMRLAQVKGAIRHCDHVVCLCDADRHYIVSRGWKPPTGASVIPPGADSLLVAGEPARSGKRLLFVGSWHFRKGIATLVAAFTALCERHAEATLTVAGSNAPAEVVLASFPERVRYAVVVQPPLTDEQLARLYLSHDIFVLPSLYEGFGMVFLEAMSAGLAVVGTDTGGMPDLIENGTDGFIVPRYDAAAFQSAVERLLANSALRAAVGERARAKAARHTWERAARDTAARYTQLLNRAGGLASERSS